MVTVVNLPTCPIPTSVEYQPIESGQDIAGQLGSADQRVLMPGDRFQVTYSYSPMPAEDAMVLMAALMAGRYNPINVPTPIRGFKPANVTGVTVSETPPTQGVIPVTGGTGTLKAGQFITVSSGGRRWLHSVVSDTVLNNGGSIPVQPLIRFPFAQGDAVECVSPSLEGFTPFGQKFSWQLTSQYGITFTIKEDR